VRVLVDTSVWADFINGAQTWQTEALARLVADEHDIVTCGVVVAEVLQGLRPGKVRRRLSAQYADMTWLTPVEPHTYVAAADLFSHLRRNGVTIRSTIDCVIAVVCAEGDALLLTADMDFERIAGNDASTLRLLRRA